MYRKFVFHCLFASTLISLTFLSSCGNNSTSPSRDGFSFELTVVDQSGAPISGLNISRRCSIEYDELSREKNQAGMQIPTGTDIGPLFVTASTPGADPPTEFILYPARPNPGISYTNIALYVPVACDVIVNVFNWKNIEIESFSISNPGTGYVILAYPFTDRHLNYMPNGIYCCEYIATEPVDSTVIFKDSVYFSGYTDRDPFRQSIGETNSSGSFYTTDKGYFPSLQGYQPQMGYDFEGMETELFSFSDTVEIKVLSEPPSGTEGYIYWMTREVLISNGANIFEWVFVPDDSVAVQ